MDAICAHCEASVAIGACSGCGEVAYCGAKCQTADWYGGGHFLDCAGHAPEAAMAWIGTEDDEEDPKVKERKVAKRKRALGRLARMFIPFATKRWQRELKRTVKVTELSGRAKKKQAQLALKAVKFGATKGRGGKTLRRGRSKSPKAPKKPSRWRSRSRSKSKTGQPQGQGQESQQ